jgi:RHS repeat-associated protein
MYYDSRYYNPDISRFISIDPWFGDIKNPQSLNKYSYVVNNPVKYFDPTKK